MMKSIDYAQFHSFSLVAAMYDVEAVIASICERNEWEVSAQKKRKVGKEGCSPLTTSESMDHEIKIQVGKKRVRLSYTQTDGTVLLKSARATKESFDVMCQLFDESEPIALYGIEKSGNRVSILEK